MCVQMKIKLWTLVSEVLTVFIGLQILWKVFEQMQ